MGRATLFAAAGLISALAVMPAAALDYEGWWSLGSAQCQDPDRFFGSGRTLVIQGATLRSRTLQCELMNVIGTGRDQIDMNCRRDGRERRMVLSLLANRSRLVVGRVGEKSSATFVRCGKIETAGGRGRRPVAVRLKDQGEKLLGLGEYEKALEFFTRSVKADPEYASAFNHRGFAKRLLERYPEAIEDYDEAIRLAPGEATYYSNRGVAHDGLDHLHLALADFDKALGMDPKSPTALAGRGSIYRQLGKLDQAIADLEKAIRINPGYAVALNHLGMAYRAKGDRKRALDAFNRALAIEPNDAFTLKERAAT